MMKEERIGNTFSGHKTSVGDEDPGDSFAASEKLQGDDSSIRLTEMLSSIEEEEERKESASNGREHSFEEWERHMAVCKVSLAIQKSAHEAMDMVQWENEKLKEEIKRLHEQRTLWMGHCCNQMKEVIQAKELLRQCEKEKQDLQAEVGRQLFLESKERRCSKIYQAPSEHASRISMPGRVRGAFHDFSGTAAELIDIAGSLHKSEKLVVPFDNSNESYQRESFLSQEGNDKEGVSEFFPNMDGKQSLKVEERKEVFDNAEVDGEVQLCSNSNVHSFDSDSEVAAVSFHAEILDESSFVDGTLSEERCDSASSLSQLSDVSSIGVQSEERSQSTSVITKQFESGGLKGACGGGDERGREGSYESSARDGAEGQFNFNHHFNDTVDGAVILPDRAQDSLMPEDFTDVSQDSLCYGVTARRQNVSGERITAQKDKARNQSDSQESNESNRWEHLGARPRDRPPKTDRPPEPSLLYSLENVVPGHVAGPVAHGVTNAFLGRHSEDKNLHESLYYTNAEKMSTENPSLQGASYVDDMMDLMDSNKVELTFDDCQFASRKDSQGEESQERSLSPSFTGEQCENGGLKGACGAGDERGREGSYESSAQDGAEGQFNFNHHLNGTLDGAVILPERAQHSKMPVDLTGVNQDSLPYEDTTWRQSVSGAGITAQKDTAADQSVSQTGGAYRMFEEERAVRAERGLRATTFVVDSLDSTHNSHWASEEGVEAAEARIQARWPWFERWCGTCADGLHNNQDVDAICTNCFKYKHCGPCEARPQSGHDECSVCLQDAFSGLQVLPCSHRVCLQCLVLLIQRNIIRCPACGHDFFPPG